MTESPQMLEPRRQCLLCRMGPVRPLGRRSQFFAAIDNYQEFLAVPVSGFDRTILRCDVCGFQFIDPMYTEADLQNLYGPLYKKFMRLVHPPMDHAARWQQQFVDLGVSQLHARTHGRKPRFLDIGCGMGRNMVVFQRLGFDVTGIDMNEEEIAYVRSSFGFRAECVSVEDFSTRGETFDCVLASHLIEHVTDPHSFMASVLRLMAPGGMFIVETPLASDWSANHAERYKDVYHTLFFDHYTLAMAGQAQGLQSTGMQNVALFAHDGSFNINMQVRYERSHADSTHSAMDCETIRSGRIAYDGLLADSLRWARSELNLEQAPRFAQRVLRSGRMRRWITRFRNMHRT